jgi:protein TonB
MKKRGDRFLIWALAISFGVHAAILLSFRHVTPVEAETEPSPAPITIEMRIPPPSPKPPAETPEPARVPPASRTIDAPEVSSTTGPSNAEPPAAVPGTGAPGPTDGSGDGLGTTEPSLTPTEPPKPQCSIPHAAASVVDAVSPSTPEGADDQTGTVQVRVDLAPSGAVVAATIFRSAGNLLLDQAALRAARASTYRAETRDCASVGGSYLFTVDFTQ